MNKDILAIFIIAIGLLLQTACSHTANQSSHQSSAKTIEKQTSNTRQNKTGHDIASLAKLQMGKPYRYGGASPKGFDCSGLVYYTHRQLGIQTPRTSKQQFKTAQPVNTNQLKLGDIVFFKLASTKVSHVGIYIGEGQFIHAPKSGKHVSANFLNDPFWKTRLVGGGRFY